MIFRTEQPDDNRHRYLESFQLRVRSGLDHIFYDYGSRGVAGLETGRVQSRKSASVVVCRSTRHELAWSWIFLSLDQSGWAFVEIVILWLAIAATTRAVFRRSMLAGLLLVPYLVWVSFATVLNFAIWRLN